MQPKNDRFRTRTEIDDIAFFVLSKKILNHFVKIIIAGNRSQHRVFGR